MSTMKALVMQGDKRAAIVTDRPLPKPRPGYVHVKVNHVALNPTDWKHIEYFNDPGSLVGCDFAGTVEEIGESYSKDWRKGDRICGFAHGGDMVQHENGAFAEHIVAKADAMFRIPEKMSDQDASTLGVGMITCGQGLYQAMGLNYPGQEKKTNEYILIYGGSTATGTLGIQCAKLSGYNVITTCSPRNFDLVKSLGATEAFDYNDPEAISKIKELTKGELKYVWDTISEGDSPKFCGQVISSGGHYGTLLPVKEAPRDNITMTATLGYTAMGEAFKMRGDIPAKPDHFEFAKKWAEIVDQLLQGGKIKVHPVKAMEGGLDGILEGCKLLKENKVSGNKLVYTVA